MDQLRHALLSLGSGSRRGGPEEGASPTGVSRDPRAGDGQKHRGEPDTRDRHTDHTNRTPSKPTHPPTRAPDAPVPTVPQKHRGRTSSPGSVQGTRAVLTLDTHKGIHNWTEFAVCQFREIHKAQGKATWSPYARRPQLGKVMGTVRVWQTSIA
jgi:hypothetical protein